MTLSYQQRQALAAERKKFNRFSRTAEGINPYADIAGVAGEIAFCEEAGIPVEAIPRNKRTSGWTFEWRGKKVKVHTATQSEGKRPNRLMVKQRKTTLPADIYVEALFIADRSANPGGLATMIGWTTRAEVEAKVPFDPTKDKRGMIAHVMDWSELRPMVELFDPEAYEAMKFAQDGDEPEPDVAPEPAAPSVMQQGMFDLGAAPAWRDR